MFSGFLGLGQLSHFLRVVLFIPRLLVVLVLMMVKGREGEKRGLKVEKRWMMEMYLGEISWCFIQYRLSTDPLIILCLLFLPASSLSSSIRPSFLLLLFLLIFFLISFLVICFFVFSISHSLS
jgi:hypothetical protein